MVQYLIIFKDKSERTLKSKGLLKFEMDGELLMISRTTDENEKSIFGLQYLMVAMIKDWLEIYKIENDQE